MKRIYRQIKRQTGEHGGACFPKSLASFGGICCKNKTFEISIVFLRDGNVFLPCYLETDYLIHLMHALRCILRVLWEEVVAFRLSVCKPAQIAFFSLDFTIVSARRPQGTLP